MKFLDYILIDEVKDMNKNRGKFYSDDTSYENVDAINDTARFLEAHFSVYNSNLLYLALSDVYHLIYDNKLEANYTLVDNSLKTIYFQKTNSEDNVYGEIVEPEEYNKTIYCDGNISVIYDGEKYISKKYIFMDNQLIIKANIDGNLYLKKATLIGDDIYYRLSRVVNDKNEYMLEYFNNPELNQVDLKTYISNTISDNEIEDVKLLFPEVFENIELYNKSKFTRINKRK